MGDLYIRTLISCKFILKKREFFLL